MATVAETLQKRTKRVLERGVVKPQNLQSQAGLQRRKELQGLMRGRVGPTGAQRIRAAPRTSQPQVQKGQRPGQALLRTGRPQGGRGRRREPR